MLHLLDLRMRLRPENETVINPQLGSRRQTAMKRTVVIGNSGGYWLYYGSQRLHVDSLVLGPLYVVPPSEFPESCTAAE